MTTEPQKCYETGNPEAKPKHGICDCTRLRIEALHFQQYFVNTNDDYEKQVQILGLEVLEVFCGARWRTPQIPAFSRHKSFIMAGRPVALNALRRDPLSSYWINICSAVFRFPVTVSTCLNSRDSFGWEIQQAGLHPRGINYTTHWRNQRFTTTSFYTELISNY